MLELQILGQTSLYVLSDEITAGLIYSKRHANTDT